MEDFKDFIPLISRLAMENMEKALWDQVKVKPIEEVQEEVDGWVSDPGSTAGRALAYDRMVMIYWVLMNLVSQVNLKSMAIIEGKMAVMLAKKEGDEDLVKSWKEHNEECKNILDEVEALSMDCRLMHRKVDQIASCLGIALYYPRMEQITSGGSGRRASRRNAGAPPMEHNVEVVL